MKLRDDPTVASAMAAAFTQSNSFKLTGMIGRRPSDSELYMAHFMGVGGAAKLIGNAEDNPQASAARLFPNAAAANRSIFYDRTTGRRAQRVRGLFGASATLRQRRFIIGNPNRDGVRRRRYQASRGGSERSTKFVSHPAVDTATYLSTFPDTRSAAPAASTAPLRRSRWHQSRRHPVPRRQARSSVRCFRMAMRAPPVSQTVRELWGNSASLTSDPPASSGPTTPTAAVAALRRPLRLPAAGSISSAIATARSAANRCKRRKIRRAAGLNKRSIKPAGYSERFVKRRGLFCLAMARHEGVRGFCVSRQGNDRSAVHQLDKDGPRRRTR